MPLWWLCWCYLCHYMQPAPPMQQASLISDLLFWCSCRWLDIHVGVCYHWCRHSCDMCRNNLITITVALIVTAALHSAADALLRACGKTRAITVLFALHYIYPVLHTACNPWCYLLFWGTGVTCHVILFTCSCTPHYASAGLSWLWVPWARTQQRLPRWW